MRGVCEALEGGEGCSLGPSHLLALRSLCDRMLALLDQHVPAPQKPSPPRTPPPLHTPPPPHLPPPPHTPPSQPPPTDLDSPSTGEPGQERLSVSGGRGSSRLLSQGRPLERRHVCSRRPSHSRNSSVDLEKERRGQVPTSTPPTPAEEPNASCNNVWTRRPTGSGWNTVSEARSDGSALGEIEPRRDTVPSKLATKGAIVEAANSRLYRRRAASCDDGTRFGQRRASLGSMPPSREASRLIRT